MRRARWKRKNVRRVGLRQRRPPAAGGGRLAVPRGGQGRKRAALGETFDLGKLGIPSATLPAAAHASSKNSQRQRKKKQLNASTTPTQEHHPPRDGICKLAEDLSVPEGQAKSEQAPIRRPPCARRATAPECAQAPFSLPPGAAHSLFGQDQKENGGRIPCGSRSLCSIPAPFHRSHKTTSAAPSFCGRHRCHFHRSPWTIPLSDLRRRQRLPCAGIRCPGP